jgi:hypothetical protein
LQGHTRQPFFLLGYEHEAHLFGRDPYPFFMFFFIERFFFLDFQGNTL